MRLDLVDGANGYGFRNSDTGPNDAGCQTADRKRSSCPYREAVSGLSHVIVISSRTRPSAAWRATCVPLKGSIQAGFGLGAWSIAL